MTQPTIDCMVVSFFLIYMFFKLYLERTKHKPTDYCATTALCPFTTQTAGLQYGCRMTQTWQRNLWATTVALSRQPDSNNSQ